MKLGFWILIVLAITAYSAGAQTVQGRVCDKTTGEYLPDALLSIKKAKLNTVSDKDGFFEFKKVPEGSYTISANYLGFASEEIKLKTSSDSDVTVNFELMPEVIYQEPIVITATKINIGCRNAPLNVSVINQEQIEQSSESNILPVISAKIPGLFITERGVTGFGVSPGSAGKISIRGVGGGDSSFPVLMLIDGQPQFMGIFGHPIPDSYVSSDLERVEVIKGPASVLYGTNAMGGVINLITRQQKNPGLTLNGRVMYGSYNTQKYTGSLGYRTDGFNVMASYNHDQTDGFRANSNFNIDNGFVKIGYEINNHFLLSANINQSVFKAYDPGSIYYETPGEYDNKSHWVDILRMYSYFTLANKFEKIEGGLKAYYMKGDHDLYDGWQSIDENIGMSFYQGLRLFKNNLLSVGLELKKYGGKGESLSLGQLSGKWFDVNETGLYAIMQHTLFKKLTLNSGIRYENHSLFGSEWVPQFGLVYEATGTTTFKSSVSKGFRSPSIRELYLFPVANADLQPELMWNYEITAIRYFDGKKGKAEITAFIAEGDNLITVVPNPAPPPPVKNQNSGSFSHKGVEVDFSYRATRKLMINSSYSYLKMDVPKVAAPKHQFYVGADYNAGRFNLNANLQYIGELYTNVSPATKMNYTLLNSKISYSVTKYLTVFVSGENLLDQTYQVQYGYPMPGITLFSGINIVL